MGSFTLQTLLSFHSVLALVFTLVLIAVDAFLGMSRALVKGKFSLTLLGQFVQTHVLPQIGGLIVAALVRYFSAHALGALMGTATSVIFWGAVFAVNLTLLRDVLGKLGVKVQLPTGSPVSGSGSTPAGS